MALQRDSIYQALFTQLVAALGGSIKFSSRRMFDWDRVEQLDQPALIVIAIGEREQRDDPLLPPKILMRAMVMLYARDDNGPDPTTTPETTLFTMIATIEDALKAQSGDTLTGFPMALEVPSTSLGGLVQHTWISDLQVHQGAGSGQIGATILVEMLAVDAS